ncbi:PREDICTED: amino acid permease 3-like [Populus euphratica]|uniref:Amino acid permease 3-like n=1 Tax=Populus euphratica TaxID=75702 RepID=A0AAJ6T0K5_POPEU|nr:PREDICTED: amino acid permease 3-like [Populus euphratica]
MGYAAFGNYALGNLLTGFGFYNPYWLLGIANVAIVVHLAGAYQVYCPSRCISEEDRAMDEPVARASDFQYELPRDHRSCSCWLCCRDCVGSLILQAIFKYSY